MKYAKRGRKIAKDLSEADLAHLIDGQKLYLNDPRKTPVEVQSLDLTTASFTVRIADFEDVGAEWVLPFWDVSKFLVERNSEKWAKADRATMQERSVALNRSVEVKAEAVDHQRTQAEIADLQKKISDWLVNEFPQLSRQENSNIAGKEPNAQWSAALESCLRFKGLQQIDQAFVAQYSSNPNAGEMIKGHRIVLAELGLITYQGHVVRDPTIFEGQWSKPNRRAHICTRLAFMRAMSSKLGLTSLPLFRTIYSDEGLSLPQNKGFVSTTFSGEVADALFTSGQSTRFAATYWQQIPVARLFMSYFETPELSHRYQESEAVLLFDPTNRAF